MLILVTNYPTQFNAVSTMLLLLLSFPPPSIAPTPVQVEEVFAVPHAMDTAKSLPEPAAPTYLVAASTSLELQTANQYASRALTPLELTLTSALLMRVPRLCLAEPTTEVFPPSLMPIPIALTPLSLEELSVDLIATNTATSSKVLALELLKRIPISKLA
jgi:hypothetical protein